MPQPSLLDVQNIIASQGYNPAQWQITPESNGGFVARPFNAPSLSVAQLEQEWIQGGGNAALAPFMAQVAEVESSGIPATITVEPNGAGGWQSSNGLWQISTGDLTPANNVLDPTQNAKYAWQKYMSQGLGAWQTTVQKLASQGVTPNGAASLPTTSSGNGSGSSNSQSSGSSGNSTDEYWFGPFDVTSLVGWAQQAGIDFAIATLAIALVSGGFIWLAASSPEVRTAAKTAIEAG